MTLAELTVSLSIVTSLMVATGSIMMLTGRTVAVTATQAAEAKIDDVISTITAEQRLALTVTQYSPTSIAFAVADRNGDGVNEQIIYSWSGISGDPLTRQFNGETPVALVRNVRNFNLTYFTKSAAASAPVADVESTTDELFFAKESGGSTLYAVSTTAFCSQSFAAVLPRADATAWRVTQVQFKARVTGGTTGKSWYVRLYKADAAGAPTGLVLEEQTIALNTLPGTTNWSPLVSFKANNGLSPSDRVCVVLGQVLLSGSSGASVSYDGISSGATDAFATSSTSGTTWTTPNSGRDMHVRIYGRYMYPGK